MTRARMMCLALVSALAIVALIAAPSSAAQVTLSGVVRDGDGAPVAGVIVQVRDLNVPDGVLQTTTDAGGSYVFSMPGSGSVTLTVNPEGPGGSFGFTSHSAPFNLSTSRVEDVTLPHAGTLRVEVRDGSTGGPAVDSEVTAIRPEGSTVTSDGVTMSTANDDSSCRTSSTGVCDLRVLTPGDVLGLQIEDVAGHRNSYSGISISGPLTTERITLPGPLLVSGTLTASDGSALVGARVRLERNWSTVVTSSASAADGSYTLPVEGGTVRLVATGAVTAAGRRTPYEFETDWFSLAAGSRTVSFRLPPIVAMQVEVLQSTGAPLSDARVEMDRDTSVATGLSASGVPTTAYLNRAFVNPPLVCAATDDHGSCEFPAFSVSTSVTGDVEVTAPEALPQSFPSAEFVPGDPSRRVLRLDGYARTASSGSAPGPVTMMRQWSSRPDDFTRLSTMPAQLPSGLDPLVGRVDYEITGEPGFFAPSQLVLPAGTSPQALLSVDQDGNLRDFAQAATVEGNRISFGISDSDDGVEDGIVTGSVIPVTREPSIIVTTAVPAAGTGKPYSTRLVGSGPAPPYVWEAFGASLPVGLRLDADGVISGSVPQAGTYRFAVRMRSSIPGSPWTEPRVLELRVVPIAVATVEVPDAYVGGAYSVTLKHTGGSFPSWRVAGGALPPGLKLSSTGTISGAPTTPGSFAFDVTVTSGGSTSPPQRLTMTVRAMEVATAVLPDAPVGASYSQKLTTRGGKGTLAWSVAGGALPPGLALSSAGTISGRPTTVGTYSVTVKVADQSVPKQVATRTLTITVTPMTITTSALPGAKKGVYYASKLTASGGKATLAWSIVGGALPTGLTLSAAGNISGYPKTPGTWTFTVKVADSSVPKNIATRTLSITVT